MGLQPSSAAIILLFLSFISLMTQGGHSLSDILISFSSIFVKTILGVLDVEGGIPVAGSETTQSITPICFPFYKLTYCMSQCVGPPHACI